MSLRHLLDEPLYTALLNRLNTSPTNGWSSGKGMCIFPAFVDFKLSIPYGCFISSTFT